MGRQGGIAIFLGSDLGVTGYVDDGKALAHSKSSLNKKKWKRHPHMEGQRISSKYFGAASVEAAFLWNGLPRAMRRLSDSGAFRRLVGHCVTAGIGDGDDPRLDGDGTDLPADWFDPDALRNLDLSEDSVGSLRLTARTVDSLGGNFSVSSSVREEELRSRSVREEELRSECAEGFRDPSLALRMTGGATEDKQFLYQPRFQLKGVRELLHDLDAARGCVVGQKTSKYLVAHRFVDDGTTREWVDFDAMGNCHGWGKAARERSPYGKRPTRRIRVWVHACEVVRTDWDAKLGRYFIERFGRAWNEGVVSDWLVLDGYDVASAYDLQCAPLVLHGPTEDGTGVYVVFTAIEVSEKQGRHWVRLPFVCTMRVSDVAESSEIGVQSYEFEQNFQDARAVLVAVPGRVEEGVNRRNYDFDDYCDLLDLKARWLDGVFEGVGIEVKSYGASGCGYRGDGIGPFATCPYRGDGVLVRAGP